MRATVRSRSRPFAQATCLQGFPSQRANRSEPERTPNLAILATDSGARIRARTDFTLAPGAEAARRFGLYLHGFSGATVASLGHLPSYAASAAGSGSSSASPCIAAVRTVLRRRSTALSTRPREQHDHEQDRGCGRRSEEIDAETACLHSISRGEHRCGRHESRKSEPGDERETPGLLARIDLHVFPLLERPVPELSRHEQTRSEERCERVERHVVHGQVEGIHRSEHDERGRQ